jgi:RNA polymerase sigma-70 factor (ECF subfamily)
LQPSDRELAARFTRGGVDAEDAFRALFGRHTPRLYALALRLLGGRQPDAEDAVQEMWMRAAEGLARFEWRAALTTWLSAILINCARERMRQWTRQRADGGSDWGDDPAASEQIASVVAPVGQTIDLERAMAALPDGYRTVLVLHDVEGYTHEQIATQLDIDVGTSKSQLSRARRAMRARLGAPPRQGVTS